MWDEEKQSRLIESILIRFPLPAFYFDGTVQKKWLVVDGLQRLQQYQEFVIKKSLKLVNLEVFNTSSNGDGYDKLGRDLQRIIGDADDYLHHQSGTPMTSSLTSSETH